MSKTGNHDEKTGPKLSGSFDPTKITLRMACLCLILGTFSAKLRQNAHFCAPGKTLREADLISAFVFATLIVHIIFFLNPKFQASSLLLCLYSSVYVRSVRKPHHWFSNETVHFMLHCYLCHQAPLPMSYHDLPSQVPIFSVFSTRLAFYHPIRYHHQTVASFSRRMS